MKSKFKIFVNMLLIALTLTACFNSGNGGNGGNGGTGNDETGNDGTSGITTKSWSDGVVN